MSRDASGRARGTENGPAVAQIAGGFATKSAEIERCKRGLPREDWHLIESQSGISSSNELFDSYLSLLIAITYKIMVVGPADPSMASQFPAHPNALANRRLDWTAGTYEPTHMTGAHQGRAHKGDTLRRCLASVR